MKIGGVPGAAVVVVKDDQIVHLAAFGVTSVETGVPVTPDTLFRLGSTSKVFTALAALHLAGEKRLDLHRPIGEIVPGLAPPLRRLTMEQLLTHTAGLAQDAPMYGPLEERALHERVTSLDAASFFTEPGEIFSYANDGYTIAGDVIAAITGQPFSAAIRSLVLEPMRMSVSTYQPLDAFTHPVALGHERGADGTSHVIRPFPEHAGNYPPGSLFTSAAELGRFLIALTPATIARLAAPHVEIPAQRRHYGYGVIVDGNRGEPVLLHTGARLGYGSIFMFLPSQHAAVAILTNRTGAIFSSAAFSALEQFTAIPFHDAPQPDGDLPSTAAELSAFSGTYENGALRVELIAADGALALRLKNRTVPVRRTGPSSFHIDKGGELENFLIIMDRNGLPRYLAAETYALRKRS